MALAAGVFLGLCVGCSKEGGTTSTNKAALNKDSKPEALDERKPPPPPPPPPVSNKKN
jgi:hypothetical protein